MSWFAVIHFVWFAVCTIVDIDSVSLVRRCDRYHYRFRQWSAGAEHFLVGPTLIKQNRMAAMSDSRSRLDLQVNRFTRREVTRFLRATGRLAQHMRIEQEKILSPELHEKKSTASTRFLDDRLRPNWRDFNLNNASVMLQLHHAAL